VKISLKGNTDALSDESNRFGLGMNAAETEEIFAVSSLHCIATRAR